ncbi:MAG: hypothetical protein ACT4RN_09975 [Pseudonocardia sp.]
MNDDNTEIRSDNDSALLDELDQLEIVEASELQEGVAFHAFRFRVQ